MFAMIFEHRILAQRLRKTMLTPKVDFFNPSQYGPRVRRTKSHLANMPRPDAGVVAQGAGHPGMN